MNRTKRSPGTQNSGENCKRPKLDKDKITSNSSISHIITTEEEADAKLDELRHGDPVLKLDLPPPPCAVPDIIISNPDQSKKLLETMLHPLRPSSFLNHCFRKKAVHIQSNNSQRAQDIVENYLFSLDAKQIFHETSSDSVFLWIPPKKEDEGDNESKALHSIELSDPDTAHLLHKHSNYASYCRAPPELEQPLVSQMLADTGIGLGQYDPTGTKVTALGRGEVETFIGTRGHVTDWHTDFQENFTIQLSGCKKWTLKQGTVIHPIRGTTPHYRSTPDVIENQLKAARLSNPNFQFGMQNLETNAHGKEEEIILNAGDVLYFPAGMWHKVETLEYGVSINISLMGSTYASLVCRSLEHLLLGKDRWREVICGHGSSSVSGEVSDSDSGSDVLQKLDSLLEELPNVVRDFRNNNGALGILPPVMRQKPSYKIISEEQENDSNGELRQQECDDREYEDVTDADDEHTGDNDSEKSPNQNKDTSGAQSDDDDNGYETEEEIINVQDFECPDDVNLKRYSDGCNIYVKNPLASLMRMKDVQSYFSTMDKIGSGDNDVDNDADPNENLFILNVNFAGNETHESSVRIKLRDTSGQLETFCRLEQESPVCNEISLKELVPEPHAALMYYGYLSWK